MSFADPGFVALVEGTTRRPQSEFFKINQELKAYWDKVLSAQRAYAVQPTKNPADLPHGKNPGSAAYASAQTLRIVIRNTSLLAIARYADLPITTAISNCDYDPSGEWFRISGDKALFNQNDQDWMNHGEIEYKVFRAFGLRLYEICERVSSKANKDCFDYASRRLPSAREEMAKLFAIDSTMPHTLSVLGGRDIDFPDRIRCVRKVVSLLPGP